MGFNIGLRKWGDLDAGIVAAIRGFASEHGSHGDDVLDDKWWQIAHAAAPAPSRHALADRYGSATAYALEHVLDESLKLQRWKTAHPGTKVEWLVFPPFSFVDSYEGDPAFWTRLSSGSLALMLGDPIILLEQWRGAYDTPQSRKFRDASRVAFETLERCKPGDDDDHAVRGVEYAMFQLLREGWDQRVPIVINW